MFGRVVYSYVSRDWSQDEFLRLGGFTVVFLNYNKAAFIEKSVASALDQDFPLCEMFFMDDASTDGSGETMERLVRAYRGRHKVTVVRNTENQHICGQWNIVSKLATGNWFGMFCGDDVAYSNRVSQVAAVVRQYPTLLGLCTNGTMRNVKTGEVEGRINFSRERVFASGESDPFDIARWKYPIIGATAFWHRSLFDRPLTKAPLDDVLLRWIVQSRSTGASPTWLWAGDLETVEYAIGCGITSEQVDSDIGTMSLVASWVARVEKNRRFAVLVESTSRAAYEWARVLCGNEQLRVAVKWKMAESRIYYEGSFLRAMEYFRMISFVLSGVRCRHIIYLALLDTRILLHELFGLRFAGFISCVIFKRNGI